MRYAKSKQINIENLNVRYFIGGRGEPLLILHGGNSHASLWAKNMRVLARKYTIYVPDLPGFGRSEAMAGNYYVPELVAFVRRFTQAVGLESFHLMGHSLGGAIAASFALQYPQQVKKLVLIDSMCMGDEIALWVRLCTAPLVFRCVQRSLMTAFRLIKRVVQGVERAINVYIPFSEASLIIGPSVANLHVQPMVLLQQLSGINAPTLVVWGENDRIVPVKHAYALAGVIPDCRLKIYEACGHSSYYENLPEFSRLVGHFLGE